MKFFTSFALGYFILIASASPEARAEIPPAKFFTVLGKKESHTNDSPKPGDHGTAFGRYQIRQKCVDDVNEKAGTNYRAEQCQGNYALSQWIAERYLNRWATERRLGHVPTFDDFALIWNGGPYACFEGGAIDKDGTLPKSKKVLETVIRCQKNARVYLRDFNKILAEQES